MPLDDKKFDIVWFDSKSSDAAMLALYLPPEEEWREKRARAFPFRMWRNSPVPNPDGTFSKKSMCVCVNVPGSARLSPGREQDKKALISEYCSEIVQCDGFTGAYIRPEVWARPEFVKAAEEDKEKDARNVERRDKRRAEIEASAALEHQAAAKRFLLARASLTRISWRTPSAVLQDICLMDMIEDKQQRPIEFEDWMGAVCRAPEIPKPAGPYDPRTFPAEAMKVFGSMVGAHDYDAKNPMEKNIALKSRSNLLAG